MYSIGQFALILKLSTRTLRHYDDIGLMKPSYVDSVTSYRFYEKEQISVAKEIIALRDSGLQLDEIKRFLDYRESEKKSEIIKYRLEKLEDEINSLINMKNKLKKLLDDRDSLEFKSEIYNIENVTIDDIYTISKRVKIDLRFIGEEVGKLYSEANRLGLRTCGGHIVLYDNVEFDPANAEVEIALPIIRLKEIKAHYKCIKGGRYLKTTVNSVSEKGEAHAAMLDLANLKGIKLKTSPMEIYSTESGRFKVEVMYCLE
jgi:DNA-binding transcriptional MerR regulator